MDTFNTIPFHFQANETLSSLALVWGLQSETITMTDEKGWMENEAPAWVVSSLPSMWPSSAVWVPKSTDAVQSTLAMLALDEQSSKSLAEWTDAALYLQGIAPSSCLGFTEVLELRAHFPFSGHQLCASRQNSRRQIFLF